VEKFVASTTLTGDLAWQNSHLIDRGLEEFVTALKHSDGGDISACGSITLVRALLFAGLLDTLTLLIHPSSPAPDGTCSSPTTRQRGSPCRTLATPPTATPSWTTACAPCREGVRRAGSGADRAMPMLGR